jgi:fumarate hydratase class II
MPASGSTMAAQLISQVCDEILAGQHRDMFPLHVDDGQRHSST